MTKPIKLICGKTSVSDEREIFVPVLVQRSPIVVRPRRVKGRYEFVNFLQDGRLDAPFLRTEETFQEAGGRFWEKKGGRWVPVVR